jgi:hypothetical protein
MSDQDQLRKAKSDRKGQGSKDARLTKRNKNLTSDLPDRQKAQAAEDSMAERLVAADTRRTNKGNIQYGLDTMAVILGMRRDGLTLEQIAAKRQIGTIKLPCAATISDIAHANPEFSEAMKRARKEYERSIVEDSIQQIPKISRVPGLKGATKARALADHARVGLALGRQALPEDYSGDQDAEVEVIVFETSGGWVPTRIARRVDGVPMGQGVEGDAAAERWRKIREQGTEVGGDK